MRHRPEGRSQDAHRLGRLGMPRPFLSPLWVVLWVLAAAQEPAGMKAVLGEIAEFAPGLLAGVVPVTLPRDAGLEAPGLRWLKKSQTPRSEAVIETAATGTRTAWPEGFVGAVVVV